MVARDSDKAQGALLLCRLAQHLYHSRHDNSIVSARELGSPRFVAEALSTFSPVVTDSVPLEHDISLRLLDLPETRGREAEALFAGYMAEFGARPDGGARSLLQLIAHAADADVGPKLFFHYWLSENLRFWLGPRGFQLSGLESEISALRRNIQNMLTVGINLRGRTPADFLAARYSICEERSAAQPDDQAVLNTITSCAAFAGAGLLETLEVMTLAPPCPLFSCEVFGLLAGRLYGRKRLLQLETYGQKLADYFVSD